MIVEKSDGTSFVVPSRIHLDSWNANQCGKVTNKGKPYLFPLPECPVDVFKRIGINVSIEGFCSVSPSNSFLGRNDKKDYVCLSTKEIAAIEKQPERRLDLLEPRPWLSWSDCHVQDREAPSEDMSPFEGRLFSEMTESTENI